MQDYLLSLLWRIWKEIISYLFRLLLYVQVPHMLFDFKTLP
jgi:hypothetical protein